MTTLKRTFDLETRTLLLKDRCYVGQVCDHLSTTLEFAYDPADALTDGMYTAYIMFDMYDDDGNIFIFGPGSTPIFDGKRFEIPVAITRRMRNQRLDYQLWLVKNRTEWNGRVEELGDTEYLFSLKDTLVFRPSIVSRNSPINPDDPILQPGLEPGVMGWLNYLRDHSVLTPFIERYGTLADGREGVTLHIPTYNGDRDQDLELSIPYLDSEGMIDIHTFLRIVEDANPDVTHDQIMTALCVQNLLDTKVDKASVVDSWENMTPEGIEIPSAELTKATFDKKLDKMSVIGAWDQISEEKIEAPSAELTKNTLDEKVDKASIIGSWSEASENVVPSAKLTKDTLDTKADKAFPIPPWDPTVEYADSATVTANQNVYISLKDGNKGHSVTDTAWWSTVTEFDTTVDTWDTGKDAWSAYSDSPGRSPSARLMRKQPVAPWDEAIRYDNENLVMHNKVLFISMADNNLGHEPRLYGSDGSGQADTYWWLPIRGGSGDDPSEATVYRIIGGETSKDPETGMYVYEVEHTFNTSNLFVTARTFGEDGRSYIFNALYDVTATDRVRVMTTDPLADNSVVVYVSPGGGEDGILIGGGAPIDAATGMYAYDVPHHFNSCDLFVSARTYGGSRSYIFEAMYDVTNPNKVRVLTNGIVPYNSVMVYISSGGGRSGDLIGGAAIIDDATGMYAYDVYHHFDTSNLFVTARTYDETGTKGSYIFNALYDVSDPGKVRVLTNKPLQNRSVMVNITLGNGRDADKIYDTFQVVTEKGRMNGYAGLDKDAKVPIVNLPVATDWDDTENRIPSTEMVLQAIAPRVTIVFGNATSKDYTLTHDLGTLDYICTVRRNTGNREVIYPTIYTLNENSVRVILDTVPGVNGLTINLIGMN